MQQELEKLEALDLALAPKQKTTRLAMGALDLAHSTASLLPGIGEDRARYQQYRGARRSWRSWQPFTVARVSSGRQCVSSRVRLRCISARLAVEAKVGEEVGNPLRPSSAAGDWLTCATRWPCSCCKTATVPAAVRYSSVHRLTAKATTPCTQPRSTISHATTDATAT